MEKESKPTVFLGITGGIAAYKMPEFVRLLIKEGYGVQAGMTKNAERFVTPEVLRALSGRRVLTADWDVQDDPFDHINLTRGTSAAIIAPATANFIAKMAHGLADDLLSTAVLALDCPLLVAPAMNPRMLKNPAVADNLRILESRGVIIIPPASGEMACGDTGEGRLAPPETLLEYVGRACSRRGALAGKRVLITAGPTQEPLDAVRYLSNRSSGRMGVALARAAARRGAEVTLVHGPLAVAVPAGMTAVSVRTAREMADEVKKRFVECDMLIMAAAVADFRPASTAPGKVKKDDVPLRVELEPNPDILEYCGRNKGGRTVVGFAAETRDLLSNAMEKMVKKNLDVICANDVGGTDTGFDGAYNDVLIIARGREAVRTGRVSKESAAESILDEALAPRPAGGAAAGNRE